MEQKNEKQAKTNRNSKKNGNLNNGQVFTFGKIEFFRSKEHPNSVKTNDDFISAYLFNGSIKVEKTDEKDINLHTICHIDPRSVKGFGISTDHKFLILELI